MKENYYLYFEKLGLMNYFPLWLSGARTVMAHAEDQDKYLPFEWQEEYYKLLGTEITSEFIREQIIKYNTVGGSSVWKHYFVTSIFYDLEKQDFRCNIYTSDNHLYVLPKGAKKADYSVPEGAEMITHDEQNQSSTGIRVFRMMISSGKARMLPFKKLPIEGYRCDITIKDIQGMDKRLRDELDYNRTLYYRP